MGKFSLASSLADELGKSTEEAMRFVDEVGAPRARSILDEAASGASRTVSNWWKPTAATGGIIGGGALAWRQQDLQQARAIADQQQDYTSGVQSIMESDLPPEQKQELIDQLNSSSPASGTNEGNNGGGGGLLGGDMQTTIILVIVMVFVLKFALDGDE